ncbi:hypothetical protein TNCV_4714211 [Trichonephila clavipes]|nr:hypothetical protein TNCV_4714211 [Trichonephila clavipes]
MGAQPYSSGQKTSNQPGVRKLTSEVYTESERIATMRKKWYLSVRVLRKKAESTASHFLHTLYTLHKRLMRNAASPPLSVSLCRKAGVVSLVGEDEMWLQVEETNGVSREVGMHCNLS